MIGRLFKMLCIHALCDYPLQGEFLARGKDPYTPHAGVSWYQCLAAHALIQGGGVMVATGSPALGVAETIAHAAIDYGKCAGKFGYNTDQALHVGCKVLWAVIAEGPALFFNYQLQQESEDTEDDNDIADLNGKDDDDELEDVDEEEDSDLEIL